MDFDLAKKHSKEVDQRRKEAKRKLEQQRKDENLQAQLEEEHRSREEQRLREAEDERIRLEQEALLNGGIRYRARLKPVPAARTDDKLELPPSALEELERQNAIEKGELLTFSVSVPSGATTGDLALGRTHAGVAEFTAEEGTVGVPPRVALCLTKGAGLDSLANVSLVEVRFTRVPRFAKSRVKFQPRGEGFHVGGASTMRMDLEHVLLESLRGHTALTEGDWVPLRFDGHTFELVVRELEPEPLLALLDTDLTVEVLPSEQTEAELRAEEERQAKAEAAAREAEERERHRLETARKKAEALAPEPPPGADVVQLLLRLPDGGRLQRRFARSSRLQEVLDWVESEPDTRVQPDNFRIVQKWPGHCREIGPDEAAETLEGLKFSRQEALFLQRLGETIENSPLPAEEEVETVAATAPSAPRPPPLGDEGGAWAAAQADAHRQLDKRIEGEDTPTAAISQQPELEGLKGQDLVFVFERLVAFGMEPPQAAIASKRFSAQLKELGDMGFDDWLRAVRLLEKYDGRLLRVANLLSEEPAAGEAFETATPAVSSVAPPPVVAGAAVASTAPASVPAPAATAPAKDTGAGLPKEAVAAKFKELIANGKSPNEAAALAIKHVRETVNAEAAACNSPVPEEEPTPVEAVGADVAVEEKLRELTSMGFTDEERNRTLIRKYAGRMDRVVEALVAG